MTGVPQSAVVQTPKSLADAMVAALDGSAGSFWLDPCVGDGAFVSAIAEQGVSADRILGVELSPQDSKCLPGKVAWKSDFLEWSISNPRLADRIAMNPPYVALSRVPKALMSSARRAMAAEGLELTLTSNYWAFFVHAAMRCLRIHGEMVVILPASWDFAEYAIAVRRHVFSSFRETVVLRSKRSLFPGLQDGAIVVVAKGFQETPISQTRVEVTDRSHLEKVLLSMCKRVEGASSVVHHFPVLPAAPLVPLSEFLDVRIGAVTGNAKYFLLTEPQRVAANVPLSCVKPVVSRSHHLTGAFISRASWRKLKEKGERVWLINPTTKARARDLADYLKSDVVATVRQAFKVRARDPWYLTPLPRSVHGFISGMRECLPFMALKAMTGLSATNTLYVITFRRSLTTQQREGIALALLSSDARQQLRRRARVYGDGLRKFEPSDILGVQIPKVFPVTETKSTLRKATTFLLEGDAAKCEALVDRWLAGVSSTSTLPVSKAS